MTRVKSTVLVESCCWDGSVGSSSGTGTNVPQGGTGCERSWMLMVTVTQQVVWVSSLAVSHRPSFQRDAERVLGDTRSSGQVPCDNKVSQKWDSSLKTTCWVRVLGDVDMVLSTVAVTVYRKSSSELASTKSGPTLVWPTSPNLSSPCPVQSEL